VPTFEERVAYLEGRVDEHSRSVDGIREAVVSSEHRADARFISLDQRLEAFEQRADARFVSLDQALVSLEHRADARFISLDQRLEAFEQRVDRRFEGVERRLDGLDEKVTRYFVWLVGVLVTTLAAVVAAVVGR
jgi:hypothetical protein